MAPLPPLPQVPLKICAADRMGDACFEKINLIFVLSVAASIVIGYAVMKFEQRVFIPCLNSKPWFSKEQREAELSAK